MPNGLAGLIFDEALPAPVEWRLPTYFDGCGHTNYGRYMFSSVQKDCESCKQFYCVVCARLGSHSCVNCWSSIPHGMPQLHECRAALTVTDGDEFDPDIIGAYWKQIADQEREARRSEERAARERQEYLERRNRNLRRGTEQLANSMSTWATAIAETNVSVNAMAEAVNSQLRYYNAISESRLVTVDPGISPTVDAARAAEPAPEPIEPEPEPAPTPTYQSAGIVHHGVPYPTVPSSWYHQLSDRANQATGRIIRSQRAR